MSFWQPLFGSYDNQKGGSLVLGFDFGGLGLGSGVYLGAAKCRLILGVLRFLSIFLVHNLLLPVLAVCVGFVFQYRNRPPGHLPSQCWFYSG